MYSASYLARFFQLALCCLLIAGCVPNQEIFDPESVKPIILENGKKWSLALKSKDKAIIQELYDKDAHYLPDNENTIHGLENITQYWEGSFGFLDDIQLSLQTLEGNRDILYETGTGIAIIASAENKDTLSFKYTNVWKRQADNTYKVVIDMFNDVKSP